ncbi:MAG: Fic family protein [Clostridia bacterium]
MKNRAGEYIVALHGALSYKAYKPNSLPPFPNLEIDEEMMLLLSEAHNLLGKLDMLAELLPDKELFLGAYVRKEALLSSQIEGTQATLEDILDPEIEISTNLDVGDVVNYINALNYAISEMKSLPLCNRLLCMTHRVLMDGVRGQEKSPGEFRKSQNWIGAKNSTLATARYIPPTVDDMKIAMSELEKYINENETDILIKTALVHYQFETIHPYLDGNGRIGRMLITLMLLDSQILKSPILYLSLFLKTNRIEYYDRLSEVRNKGNYEQWVKFFLTGVVATCKDSISTIARISLLIKADTLKIQKESMSVKKVYEYLKEHPIINIKGAATALDLSFNTIATALNKLTALDIVHEQTSKARSRIFDYSAYIEILKSGI